MFHNAKSSVTRYTTKEKKRLSRAKKDSSQQVQGSDGHVRDNFFFFKENCSVSIQSATDTMTESLTLFKSSRVILTPREAVSGEKIFLLS